VLSHHRAEPLGLEYQRLVDGGTKPNLAELASSSEAVDGHRSPAWRLRCRCPGVLETCHVTPPARRAGRRGGWTNTEALLHAQTKLDAKEHA
jgi:hypothetical protein